MFERLTEGARRTIFFSRYEASQLGSPEITPEHLLLGLLREAKVLLGDFLPAHRGEDIRRQIEEQSPPAGEKLSTSVDMPLSSASKKVLDRAAEEADRLKDATIGNEHLFLGLLGLVGEERYPATEILRGYGLELTKVRGEIEQAAYDVRHRWDKGWRAKLADHKASPWRPAAAPAFEDIPRGEGGRWGGGLIRKTEAFGRLFHWERRQCEPEDKLVERSSGRVALYTGGPFDPKKFDRVDRGWTHYHCAICWRDLFDPRDPNASAAWTNGLDRLCDRCYAAFVQRGE
ncbi:MAG TPA: Clp protease N-terminal domain-containing protein [Terriglobia bacterium]|nr:Clp protease N-terminal domain-containing protein [Terriglobia bacterium]